MKLGTALVAASLGAALAAPAFAEDRLLDDAVEFSGSVFFAAHDMPGMILGAIRGGEVSVHGFGRRDDGTDQPPDADTRMRIGSITKTFTGEVLAHLVADGKIAFTDTVGQHLDRSIPEMDGGKIRLIDLATHTSGLPREMDSEPDGPDETVTKESFMAALKDEPLRFKPGTGILYSNVAYDLLAFALAAGTGEPYEALLRENVLEPAGLTSTTYGLPADAGSNVFQGHGIDGAALPTITEASGFHGSGTLYSSAGDILRWLRWHLGRDETHGAEARLLDHAAYVFRDAMTPAYGMDESGHMDAIGLGWVIMFPNGGRPLILQKAGGAQGVFTYVAFAPNRDVGVFVAINEFNFNAAMAMAGMVNELIAQLAPR